MSPSAATIEEGIDLAWLASVATDDPVSHAYARWDLFHASDRVRFVTVREGGRPTAYLLIWYGWRPFPVIHWVGATERPDLLATGLPERPLIAVVPSEVAPIVDRLRGPTTTYPIGVLEHPVDAPLPKVETPVRPLTSADAKHIARLLSRQNELLVTAYPTLDLDQAVVFGAFEEGQLVAVARVAVELPDIWILGGIFTAPEARGRGYGTALTGSLTRAAHAAGARAALFVRDDNESANRIYSRLGYRRVFGRLWLDAGADIPP